jgi:cytochrome c peroxidase
MRSVSKTLLLALFCNSLVISSGMAGKANPCNDHSTKFKPLGCVPIPQPHTAQINHNAAKLLGKALFWDVQVGSDNQVACATCHFRAGADVRVINSLNPGPDLLFSSGGVHGPGARFSPSDITNDDRLGSQGVSLATFLGIDKFGNELCQSAPAPQFGNARQVTGRNAPPVIGAVYNVFNFWDGRANPQFNGQDPFGNTSNSNTPGALSDFASLASQSVGPPGNSVEMSCAGRNLNGIQGIGGKLINRPALQFQKVAANDSLFASATAKNFGITPSPKKGLLCSNRGKVKACTYADLIRFAYGNVDAVNYFSRIFGESVQSYEALLIPDKTPFDAYFAGNKKAMTPLQLKGLDIFDGKGRCTECHDGPELSDATYTAFIDNGGNFLNEDGGDLGFHNTGVRPTAEDPGRAGTGPNGVSFALDPGAVANQGAFKTSQLRNLKLTAPYMHNGGKADLESVVEFYDRGGDFPNNVGFSRDMRKLGLKPSEKAALVAFMRDALTDCRVEHEKAPFDHPELAIPNFGTIGAVGAGGTGGSCPF